MDEERASRHYEEHQGKAFYGDLVDFITSGGPVLAMAWKGQNAIAEIRKMLGGATNRLKRRRVLSAGGTWLSL